ncbi:aldo/keto reductase [Nonlabens ponticola]|uniref:Aldo/keto reductase n=1 Tax=Nonlabens ponticola TaxID=2496866 RepID=A0A3S9N070_9FLAO|nr:aldo/keto reductase [Nonlabens ponticola]AZQ44810.1 aldo/keto reductase [Nonlabens ponticola]
MTTKPIGKTDLRIPPIAFGGNVFGWTIDKKQSFKMLDELYELGFNYIDTADVYSRWVDGNSGGESERIIGAWMKDRGLRDRMIIATKVGMDVGQGGISLASDHVHKQIDQSLKNLQTDYVDFYYSHRDDPDLTVATIMDTHADLISQGKVRHLGASSFPLDRFKESQDYAAKHDQPRYEIYQPEYSLINRNDFENGYQEYVQQEQIAVTNYWALANGFLTGKYDSIEQIEKSERSGNLKKYWNDRGRAILKALKTVSQDLAISQAGVTIAWTMVQPGITAPIVSATKSSQLKAFKEAISSNLTGEHIKLLNEVSA